MSLLSPVVLPNVYAPDFTSCTSTGNGVWATAGAAASMPQARIPAANAPMRLIARWKVLLSRAEQARSGRSVVVAPDAGPDARHVRSVDVDRDRGRVGR